MNRRHRIVFVLPDLQIGGAERQVVNLVNHLDPDRFEVTLFAFEKTADLAHAVRHERVRLVSVPRRFKVDTRPIARLARMLREEQVELVHCTLQISLFMAAAAVARSRRPIPIIDAIHTTRTRGWKEEVADRLLYLPLMRTCDRVIAVSDAQRAFWAAKYPSIASRMTTVHNGIDLDEYRDDVPAERKAALRRQLGIDDGDLVLAMVAAIRPEKNHQGVLEAAARLVQQGRRVKLLFLGGGLPGGEELEARLGRRTTELGLDPCVRWMGMVSDPKPLISLCDVALLFSTSTETLPLALLECLAMGKPVVSSRIGGVSEIVEDGGNGLLVPVGDVDAFTAALGHLGADRALLHRLSAGARPSVETRFSVQQMVRATERVILDVLDRREGEQARAVQEGARTGAEPLAPRRHRVEATARQAARQGGRHKVVFVVPDLQIGGAERQVVDLVNHLDHERFDATLFTFEKVKDLAAAVDQGRVRLVMQPRRFKLDLRPIERLARVIRDEEVALVHCTLQISLLVAMAAILRSGRRVPLIDAVHTTENRGWKEEVADRLLYVPLMRACDRVITVCDAQQRFWAAKYESLGPRMTTVYNGIDLQRYRDDVPGAEKERMRAELGIEDGDLVLGMVAAIRAEKNHDGVLAATRKLVDGGQRVKMLFLGGGLVPGEDERLRRRTTELGLERQVRWLGMLSDPRPMISILDVALLFSTTESFPLSLLECLAMGKPAVASRVGGVPEIVEHGKNGLLVPVGDVDALVAALTRLGTDRGLLRALAAQARPSVEARFSVRQMVRSTEEVMGRVLDGDRARAARAPPD